MKTNKIIYGALLIAMRIILERFFSIQTPVMRISFTFVPAMMTGMFFSPIASGFIGAIADIIGFFLFPSGTYFPGFTLTAFLGGFINSFFFYKKEITYKNILCVVIINGIFLNIILNTLWLKILLEKAFIPLFMSRLLKNVISMPIHFFVFYVVVYTLQKSSQFKKIIQEV